MLPVAAHALLQSIAILASSCTNFSRQCVAGLAATERGPQAVAAGLMLVTNLVPRIGYDKAAQLAKKAAASGKTLAQVAKEETDLSDADIAALLDPITMVDRPVGA